VAVAQLDFTGDASKAQAAHDRLIRENARLRESIRKTNEETVQGAQKSLKALDAWGAGLEKLRQQNDKWAAGMAKLTAANRAAVHTFEPLRRQVSGIDGSFLEALQSGGGFMGIVGRLAPLMGATAAAVSFGRKAIQDYRSELDAAAAAQANFNKNLAGDLALTRDVGQADQIEKALSSIPGIPKEKARETFTAITREMPTGGLQDRLAMTRSTARLGAVGGNVASVGALAGQLSDVLPGMKPEDVADVSALLHREAGGDIAKIGGEKMQRSIRQLTAAGVPTEQALAMALSAAQGKVSPETLNKAAQVAAASKADLMPARGARGPEAAAMRRLAGMTGAERLAAMQADPALAAAGMGDQALAFGRLAPEELRANQAMIAGVTQQDIIGGMVAAAGRTGVGGREAARAANQAGIERAREARARQEELLSLYDELIHRRAIATQGDTLATEIGFRIGSGARRIATAMSPVRAEDGSIETANKNFEVLIAVMERQVRALEEQNRKRGVNVDAHTE
jgi:hypothetical protein